MALPAFLGLALLAAGIAFVSWSSSTTLGELEHEEESAFSQIRIRRAGDIRAMTFVRADGAEAVQTRIDLSAPQVLVSPYARGMFASLLYTPAPRRVLVVGLGGGAMVRFLTHHLPDVQVDAVEIDPAVVRLADQYFGVRSGGNVRVLTSDAFRFIEDSANRYDVIFMDAFLRPSVDTDTTGVPSRLKTQEFLARLQQTLSPGGVIAFNVNDHDRLAEDIAAVSAAFGHAVVYRCPPAANKVIVATEAGLAPDDQLRARIAELDERFKGALAFADLFANRE